MVMQIKLIVVVVVTMGWGRGSLARHASKGVGREGCGRSLRFHLHFIAHVTQARRDEGQEELCFIQRATFAL